jgi:ATP-dependent DNA ligase
MRCSCSCDRALAVETGKGSDASHSDPRMGSDGSNEDAFHLSHRHDLRRDPLEVRKATLASIVAKASPGIRFNEHMEGDGPTVFAHACKLGLEGIVSKRKDSAYRSGRSPDWLKMKNSNAPAVKREAEEDRGR